MGAHLQREIENLKKKILSMGAQVEETVNKAVEALETRDPSLAQQVIDGDEALDNAEVEIEEECLKILALHQPVAIDLRYVIAVLKINNDLERIGDLAVNIAERAAYLATHAPVEVPLDFRGMVERTKRMVSDSLNALVNVDTHLARHVRAADDEVDIINRNMFAIIQDYIARHPERVAESLHLLSASRHLERIADQATNIAEDVIYMVEGEIVRHQPEDFTDSHSAPKA